MEANTPAPMALRPVEAAAALGVCRQTIYSMLDRGDLRSISIGRARRIPVHEIERILDVRRGEAAA